LRINPRSAPRAPKTTWRRVPNTKVFYHLEGGRLLHHRRERKKLARWKVGNAQRNVGGSNRAHADEDKKMGGEEEGAKKNTLPW